MKKSMIAFALVLVLAIGGPAAAAGINFSGSLETEVEWHHLEEETTVTPSSDLELQVDLNVGEDQVRGVVEFGLEESENSVFEIAGKGLTLKKAYLETDGSFWNGGPQATTRFGSLDIDYSPYISIGDRHGISVSDMEVGGLNLNAFYAIPANEAEEVEAAQEEVKEEIQGLRADLTVEDVRIGSALIRTGNVLDILVDADATPIENLKLAGVFMTQSEKEEAQVEPAQEEEEALKDTLLTFRADYQAMDNLAVYGGYKAIYGTDWYQDYLPENDEDEDEEFDWIYDQVRNKGLFLGFNTDQQGINISGDYDQVYEEASLAANTEVDGFNLSVETILDVPSANEVATRSTEFGVSKAVLLAEGLDVEASYTGEWAPEQKIRHTLGASTVLGMVPAVDGLELNAEVSFAELTKESLGYKFGADYKAPNGVTLGLEHIGGDGNAEEEDFGTTVNAGMSIEF